MIKVISFPEIMPDDRVFLFTHENGMKEITHTSYPTVFPLLTTIYLNIFLALPKGQVKSETDMGQTKALI